MQLYEEMIESEIIDVVKNYLRDLDFDCGSIIKSKAEILVESVYNILQNEELDDFMKIDKIVEEFNNQGVSCGVCHDF